jgi:hypothetical protein
MADKIAVKVSLYNGVFRVDSMPPGVELFMEDEDECVCNERTYPKGVRRVRYHLNRAGDIAESSWPAERKLN